MSNGMEYVDLTDIQNLATLDIMINHYGGACSEGIKGSVRAYFNGEVYEVPFATIASSGNRGRDKNGASSSEYWAVINPRDLFNLL